MFDDFVVVFCWCSRATHSVGVIQNVYIYIIYIHTAKQVYRKKIGFFEKNKKKNLCLRL